MRDADIAADVAVDASPAKRYEPCNPDAPNCEAGTTCYTIPDLGVSICTVTCSLNFGCMDGRGTCSNAHPTMPSSGSICIP